MGRLATYASDPTRRFIRPHAQVGVPINLAALYDDIGDAYPWVIKLPVQVRSGVVGDGSGHSADLYEAYYFIYSELSCRLALLGIAHDSEHTKASMQSVPHHVA